MNRLKTLPLFGLLLFFAFTTTVGAQSDQARLNPCAKCHSQALSQPSTDMARSLETVELCTVLINHPLLTATYGRYFYRIERKGDLSTYSVTDGTSTVTMPI